MDFSLSNRVLELRERLSAFMAEHVFPREPELGHAIDEEIAPGVAYPAAIRELRSLARAEGLWNLWLANHHQGPGLTNVEYGVLCEQMGRSLQVAPAIFNCSFPDTGNAEVLLEYGTPGQVDRFARPLLDDDIRSCFALTEPEAASSDPTNIFTTARLENDEWVLDGHKWWISGALGAEFAIVMAVTEPGATLARACSSCRLTSSASRSSGRCRSSDMPAAMGTANCASAGCVFPPTTSSAHAATDSRSPRRGWDPDASTIACGRSARRSARSSSCAVAPNSV
jgi:alkylation response protein AidB-like acyl-CoA dehydrogenase